MELFYNRSILEDMIRSNCGPITLTVEDMLECLDRKSGLDSSACQYVIERKIREAHEHACARTLGLST